MSEGALRPEDVAIRIIDKHADVIEAALRERFPSLHVSRIALQSDARLKALISFRPPEDENLDQYDWIHSTGAGVDAICSGLPETGALPVITRTTGRMGEQIAEYCVGYALEHLQQMRHRREAHASLVWDKDRTAPRFLFDSEVAVVGTGEIGRVIGATFERLGARVTGYSRSGRQREGLQRVQALQAEGSLVGADIVVLALPATQETENLVSVDLLGRLEGALLINIGRGTTLDHDALRQALDQGSVSHAVLDVFEEEPLPQADWQWTDERVTVTPHVAGLTLADDAVNRFCDLLAEVLRTGQLPDSVDVTRGY
ncbi:NAD(P)-dependent oxidoreductase [Henriciella pelagia]|uniref:2-ketoacid reductase n=1 Tax=Henriciella pelagia TaxID=1977912 RepID=A0ABQ1JXD5_9PROT|nr:NAD(P)-dependent oxidoreductase [Henriciella pelagia]GGB79745.1 2-ketoacid reductase [Henriciella pelagia]